MDFAIVLTFAGEGLPSVSVAATLAVISSVLAPRASHDQADPPIDQP